MFEYYEYVEIQRGPAKGRVGVVLGRAEQYGRFGYAVLLDGECTSYEEADLVSTGRKGNESDFYSGQSIRVNEKGEIIDAPQKTPVRGNG